MKPCPDATLTSGLLHVALVGPLGFFYALRQMPRLMRGSKLSHPAIRTFTCRSLALAGPSCSVETDGEIKITLPVRLSVRPKGLLVRVPR